MPSRINIGPENGPYVGINEENGNLQLEDNSGNVVAEWDDTNAQWDFANNTLNNVDALDSNSVNTVKARVEQVALSVDFDNNLTIPDDTATDLDFDVVRFDQLDAWDVTNGEFVAPQTGTYRFDLNLAIEGTDTSELSDLDDWAYFFFINGSFQFTTPTAIDFPGDLSGVYHLPNTLTTELSEGDTASFSFRVRGAESELVASESAGLTITRIG